MRYRLLLLLALAAPAAAQTTDLSAEKRLLDQAPVEVGAPASFLIAVTNHGPEAAPSVVAHEILPEGLVFAWATASAGSYDPERGVWEVGPLAVGQTETLSVVAVLTAGEPVENCATARSVGGEDPVAANNTSCVIVTPPTAPPPPVVHASPGRPAFAVLQ
jgi:large repetitive protein